MANDGEGKGPDVSADADVEIGTNAELERDEKAAPGLEEKDRFQVELELVQCLASPAYLHFLAQHMYLDDPDFVRYLEYLTYWKRPDYCKYIQFPHALHFLELLQDASFRAALKRPDYTLYLHQQQGYFWQYRVSSTL
ncbi:Mediator of RNA polymerase II transcription subunit 31 [Porphyridium purpureum]|uniref:Mediator of RNA polymerase II transcription subunit 31 n=1 Tax=Porphyridium purpureum TaxID=35688 RepID=A0A5J4Z021_PORPP|nr:Mediator of RNA polymerase II transcription subunit 31 [Porphyridium purpureum]|eukprot:POR5929..scf208_2